MTSFPKLLHLLSFINYTCKFWLEGRNHISVPRDDQINKTNLFTHSKSGHHHFCYFCSTVKITWCSYVKTTKHYTDKTNRNKKQASFWLFMLCPFTYLHIMKYNKYIYYTYIRVTQMQYTCIRVTQMQSIIELHHNTWVNSTTTYQ